MKKDKNEENAVLSSKDVVGTWNTYPKWKM
jgi:hypothetical protein